MNFAGGLTARDDEVLMFAAVDADRAGGAGAFHVRSGVDLIAVGAIDHIEDCTGDDVAFPGK